MRKMQNQVEPNEVSALQSPPEVTAPRAPVVHVVAPGKTVKCKAGRLNEGTAITPKSVGGPEAFSQLIASGTIVARP